MKKKLVILMLILVCSFSLFFACKGTYDDLELSLSYNDVITLYVPTTTETSNSQITITSTASGVSKKDNVQTEFSLESGNCVTISTEEIDSNITRATITAHSVGTSYIRVVAEGNVQKRLKVVVANRINDVQFTQSRVAVSEGGSVDLTDYLTFNEGTDQTNVKFQILNKYGTYVDTVTGSDADYISIIDGVLSVQNGFMTYAGSLDEATASDILWAKLSNQNEITTNYLSYTNFVSYYCLKLKAVSTVNEQIQSDDIIVPILKLVQESNIDLISSADSNANTTGETFELAEDANGEYNLVLGTRDYTGIAKDFATMRDLIIRVSANSLENVRYSVSYSYENTACSSLVSVESYGDSTLHKFKLKGLESGSCRIKFTIDYVGFEGQFTIEKYVNVTVRDFPSSVYINNQLITADEETDTDLQNYYIYDLYDENNSTSSLGTALKISGVPSGKDFSYTIELLNSTYESYTQIITGSSTLTWDSSITNSSTIYLKHNITNTDLLNQTIKAKITFTFNLNPTGTENDNYTTYSETRYINLAYKKGLSSLSLASSYSAQVGGETENLLDLSSYGIDLTPSGGFINNISVEEGYSLEYNDEQELINVLSSNGELLFSIDYSVEGIWDIIPNGNGNYGSCDLTFTTYNGITASTTVNIYIPLVQSDDGDLFLDVVEANDGILDSSYKQMFSGATQQVAYDDPQILTALKIKTYIASEPIKLSLYNFYNSGSEIVKETYNDSDYVQATITSSAFATIEKDEESDCFLLYTNGLVSTSGITIRFNIVGYDSTGNRINKTQYVTLYIYHELSANDISLNKTSISLYDFNSVGVYSSDYSSQLSLTYNRSASNFGQVATSFNLVDKVVAVINGTSIDASDILSVNEETGAIEAKMSNSTKIEALALSTGVSVDDLIQQILANGVDLQIEVTTTQFNQESIIKRCSVSVNYATKVDSLLIRSGVGSDGVYMDARTLSSTSYKTVSFTTLPSTAYNSKIVAVINGAQIVRISSLYLDSNGAIKGTSFNIQPVLVNGVVQAGVTEIKLYAQDSYLSADQPGTALMTIRVYIADGSELYPFEIKAEGELLAIQTDINNGHAYNYVLTRDINLTNLTFDGFDGDFAGTLNGKYTYTLDGETYTRYGSINNFEAIFTGDDALTSDRTIGLFESISGTVSNIKMEGAIVSVETASDITISAGILAGKITGTVNNVNIDGTLTVNGGTTVYVGGVAGENSGNINAIADASSDVNVAVAILQESTTDTVYAGGVVGYNSGVIGNADSSEFTVTANVSIEDGGLVSAVGGVVGRSVAGSINNIEVYPYLRGYANLGGIAGITENTTINAAKVYFVNNLETGLEASAIVGYKNIGGMVGQASDTTIRYSFVRSFFGADSFTSEYLGNVVLLPSSMVGDIQSVGGIVGQIVDDNDTALTSGTYSNIENSYFSADINAYYTDTYAGTVYSGGLVGSISSSIDKCDVLTISDCYVTGLNNYKSSDEDHIYGDFIAGQSESVSGTVVSESDVTVEASGVTLSDETPITVSSDASGNASVNITINNNADKTTILEFYYKANKNISVTFASDGDAYSANIFSLLNLKLNQWVFLTDPDTISDLEVVSSDPYFMDGTQHVCGIYITQEMLDSEVLTLYYSSAGTESVTVYVLGFSDNISVTGATTQSIEITGLQKSATVELREVTVQNSGSEGAALDSDITIESSYVKVNGETASYYNVEAIEGTSSRYIYSADSYDNAYMNFSWQEYMSDETTVNAKNDYIWAVNDDLNDGLPVLYRENPTADNMLLFVLAPTYVSVEVKATPSFTIEESDVAISDEDDNVLSETTPLTLHTNNDGVSLEVITIDIDNNEDRTANLKLQFRATKTLIDAFESLESINIFNFMNLKVGQTISTVAANLEDLTAEQLASYPYFIVDGSETYSIEVTQALVDSAELTLYKSASQTEADANLYIDFYTQVSVSGNSTEITLSGLEPNGTNYLIGFSIISTSFGSHSFIKVSTSKAILFYNEKESVASDENDTDENNIYYIVKSGDEIPSYSFVPFAEFSVGNTSALPGIDIADGISITTTNNDIVRISTDEQGRYYIVLKKEGLASITIASTIASNLTASLEVQVVRGVSDIVLEDQENNEEVSTINSTKIYVGSSEDYQFVPANNISNSSYVANANIGYLIKVVGSNSVLINGISMTDNTFEAFTNTSIFNIKATALGDFSIIAVPYIYTGNSDFTYKGDYTDIPDGSILLESLIKEYSFNVIQKAKSINLNNQVEISFLTNSSATLTVQYETYDFTAVTTGEGTTYTNNDSLVFELWLGDTLVGLYEYGTGNVTWLTSSIQENLEAQSNLRELLEITAGEESVEYNSTNKTIVVTRTFQFAFDSETYRQNTYSNAVKEDAYMLSNLNFTLCFTPYSNSIYSGIDNITDTSTDGVTDEINAAYSDNQTTSDRVLTKSIPLSIDTREISELTTAFYPFGETSVQEEEQDRISPGRSGLLKINLEPEINNSDYVTVTANASGVTFAQKVSSIENIGDLTSGYISLPVANVLIENGIEMRPASYYVSDSGKTTLTKADLEDIEFYGLYFLSVYVGEEFTASTLPLTITAYQFGDNGQQNAVYTQDIILQVEPLPEVSISIDGSSSIDVATGTQKEITVNVENADESTIQFLTDDNSPLGSDYDLIILDSDDILTSISVTKYKIADSDQSSLVQLVDGKYILNVPTTLLDLNNDNDPVSACGKTMYLKARVTKDVNGLEEEGTDVIEIKIRLYLITDLILDSSAASGNTLEVKNGTLTDIAMQTVIESSSDSNLLGNINSYKLALENELSGVFKNAYKIGDSFYSNSDETGTLYSTTNNWYYYVSDGDGGYRLATLTLNNSTPFGGCFALSQDLKTSVANGQQLYSNSFAISAYNITSDGYKIVGVLNYSYDEYGVPEICTDLNKPYTEIVLEVTVVVKDNSTYDHPNPIYTVEDLQDMQSGAHYILMNDLVLTDWVPLTNGDFASLDGNGYIITIQSFDVDSADATSVTAGIFETISSSSVVKNIIIDVGDLMVDSNYVNKVMSGKITSGIAIDLSGALNVTFGILAGVNNGSVTNIKVINTQASSSNDDNYLFVYSTQTNIGTRETAGTAGTIAGINNGTISTSYVGVNYNTGSTASALISGNAVGEVYTPNYSFNLVAGKTIGAFVGQNSGVITNCYSNEVGMYNLCTTSTDSITGGFVGTNTQNGEIISSFSSGEDVDTYDYRAGNNLYIESKGNIGGFVGDNAGTIRDAYSSVRVKTNSAQTAGFAYTNSGTITRSYSTTVPVQTDENDSTNTKPINSEAFGVFIGKTGTEVNNTGTVENCYYLILASDETSADATEDSIYGEVADSADPATAVEVTKDTHGQTGQDKFIYEGTYNGFSFSDGESENGIWVMTSTGPALTSSLQDEILSFRTLENEGEITSISDVILYLQSNDDSFTFEESTQIRDISVYINSKILENLAGKISDFYNDSALTDRKTGNALYNAVLGYLRSITWKASVDTAAEAIVGQSATMANAISAFNGKTSGIIVFPNSSTLAVSEDENNKYLLTETTTDILDYYSDNSSFVQSETTAKVYNYQYRVNALGTAKNPLLINSAEEFITFIINNSITQRVYSEVELGGSDDMEDGVSDGLNTTDTQLVFGYNTSADALRYVKLIKSIDFSDITINEYYVDGYRISDVIFAGVLEGNNLSITGLGSLSNQETEVLDDYGLFKRIGLVGDEDYSPQTTIVSNLNVKVVQTISVYAKRSGILAGSVYNSSIMNVNIEGEGTTAKVDGSNLVGTIAGYIGGSSKLSNITVSNIKVTSQQYNSTVVDSIASSEVLKTTVNGYNYVDYTDFVGGSFDLFDKFDPYGENNDYSYAGSIAGVIDCDSTTSAETDIVYPDFNDDTDDDYQQLSTDTSNDNVMYITVGGRIEVTAENAGGMFGYVGSNTSIKLSNFILDSSVTQKIVGRNFAGGIVAENYGTLEKVTIQTAEQLSGEDQSLYSNTTTTLFGSLVGVAAGGIAGYSENGVIINSITRANVSNNLFKIAGGVIGIAKGYNYLQHVYSTGYVDAGSKISTGNQRVIGEGIVGGIVGYSEVSYAEVEESVYKEYKDDVNWKAEFTVGEGEEATTYIININEGTVTTTTDGIVAYISTDTESKISTFTIGEGESAVTYTINSDNVTSGQKTYEFDKCYLQGELVLDFVYALNNWELNSSIQEKIVNNMEQIYGDYSSYNVIMPEVGNQEPEMATSVAYDINYSLPTVYIGSVIGLLSDNAIVPDTTDIKFSKISTTDILSNVVTGRESGYISGTSARNVNYSNSTVFSSDFYGNRCNSYTNFVQIYPDTASSAVANLYYFDDVFAINAVDIEDVDITETSLENVISSLKNSIKLSVDSDNETAINNINNSITNIISLITYLGNNTIKSLYSDSNAYTNSITAKDIIYLMDKYLSNKLWTDSEIASSTLEISAQITSIANFINGKAGTSLTGELSTIEAYLVSSTNGEFVPSTSSNENIKISTIKSYIIQNPLIWCVGTSDLSKLKTILTDAGKSVPTGTTVSNWIAFIVDLENSDSVPTYYTALKDNKYLTKLLISEISGYINSVETIYSQNAVENLLELAGVPAYYNNIFGMWEYDDDYIEDNSVNARPSNAYSAASETWKVSDGNYLPEFITGIYMNYTKINSTDELTTLLSINTKGNQFVLGENTSPDADNNEDAHTYVINTSDSDDYIFANTFEGSLNGTYTVVEGEEEVTHRTKIIINVDSTNFIGLFKTLKDASISGIDFVFNISKDYSSAVNNSAYFGRLISQMTSSSLKDVSVTINYTGTDYAGNSINLPSSVTDFGMVIGKASSSKISNVDVSITSASSLNLNGTGSINAGMFAGSLISTPTQDVDVKGSVAISVSTGSETTTKLIGLNFGGIAGQTSLSAITDVSYTGNIQIPSIINTEVTTSVANFGGLIGSASSSNITNGDFDGSITNASGIINYSVNIGGIAGTYTYGTIKNCSNSDDNGITLTTSNNVAVGGYVGEMNGSTILSGSKIATNYLPITVTSSGSNSSTIYIGGMVGYAPGTVASNSINNAINNGMIEQNGNGTENLYIGGIAGYMVGSVTTVYNVPNIEFQHKNSKVYYVGGIVGYIQGTSEISDFIMYGDITITPESGDVATLSGLQYVGGIFGRQTGITTIASGISYARVYNYNSKDISSSLTHVNSIGSTSNTIITKDKVYYIKEFIPYGYDGKTFKTTVSGSEDSVQCISYKDLSSLKTASISGFTSNSETLPYITSLGQVNTMLTGLTDIGQKLNPKEITSLSALDMDGYNILTASTRLAATISDEFKGFLVASDGVIIDNSSFDQNYAHTLFTTLTGTVANLVIKTSPFISGNLSLLAQTVESNGKVVNCTAYGDITTNNITDAVLNFVGTNTGMIVGSGNSLYFALSSGEATVNVTGLVGTNGGVVSDCYATINIDNTYGKILSCYGLVGTNSGTLTSSYFAGVIQTADNFEIIGSNSGTISNCYYDNYGYTGGNTSRVTGTLTSKFYVGENSIEDKLTSARGWTFYSQDSDNFGYVNFGYPTLTDGFAVPTIASLASTTATGVSGISGTTVYTIGAVYSSGTSATADLYALPIFQKGQLYGIKDTAADNNYILMNNIDMSGISYGLGDFSATLYGNQKTISNWKVTNNSNNGIIDKLEGYIYNLKLSSISITTSKESNIGGFIGEVVSGNVDDLYVLSAITVNSTNITGNDYGVGGLIGKNSGILTKIKVDASSTTSINGYKNVGGVVGYNAGRLDVITITNANALTVTGTQYVGGYVGYADSSSSITLIGSVSVNVEIKSSSSGYVGGLFGYLSGTLTNSSIILTGSVESTSSSSSSGYYTGGVVGYTYTVLSNFTNSAVVTGKSYVGGIAGKSEGAISSSSNSGVVSGISYVGGITGVSYSTITDCHNTATVTGTETSKSYVGGISGYSKAGIAGSTSYATYNTGSITGAGSRVGGIVGYTNSSISECRNSGVITASSYVGGIVGLSSGALTNCYNTATVTGKGTGDTYAGGIVGYSSASITGTVSGDTYSTYNSGTVSGSGNKIGGIAGESDANVSGCKNQGAVTGTSYVGGISGYSSYSTISNCYNASNIKSGYYAGGIAGYCAGEISASSNSGIIEGSNYSGGIVGRGIGSISNCSNVNTVTGSSYVGGIAGRASSTTTDCTNTGNISGDTRIGGIVGYATGAITGSSSYSTSNTGTITGSETNVGGIVGYSTANVNKCQNSGAVTGVSNVGGVVGYLNGGTVSSCSNTRNGEIRATRISGSYAAAYLVRPQTITSTGIEGIYYVTFNSPYTTYCTVSNADTYVSQIVGYRASGSVYSNSMTGSAKKTAKKYQESVSIRDDNDKKDGKNVNVSYAGINSIWSSDNWIGSWTLTGSGYYNGLTGKASHTFSTEIISGYTVVATTYPDQTVSSQTGN